MNTNNLRKLFAFVLCCLAVETVQAQIVDDSTRLMYSARTTRVLYEKEVFRGRQQENFVDTLLSHTYQPQYWYNDTIYYQDLGTNGSASQPLNLQFPSEIGARLGKNVFDRYMYRPEAIPYFDTRSPYSHLYYNQGTRGQQYFEGKYSRNIKPWWNIGMAYQGAGANKIIGSSGLSDGLIDHKGILVFMHLQSKNERYHLFTNYSHHNHLAVENGGIDVAENDPYLLLEDFRQVPILLTQAQNRDTRNRYRLSQQYKLAGKGLQLFHTFDLRRQTIRYTDNLSIDSKYYDRFIFRTDSTLDRSTFVHYDNTFGVAGNSNALYYRGFVKRRDAEILYMNPSSRKITQYFVGGEADFKWKDWVNLHGEGEYKISDEYKLKARAMLKYVWLEQSRIEYSPTLTQQEVVNNHYAWSNNFTNTVADRTAAGLNIHVFHNDINFQVNYSNFQNYIIFNQQAEPEQIASQQKVFSAQLHHHLKLGAINLKTTGVLNNTSEAPFIRIPDWFVNSRLYYEGYIFNNALFTQIGFEGRMNASYYADAYSPVNQNFYIQDGFLVESYPVIDFFIAADIKSVNAYVKLAHANEGLTELGYYTTPYYPGVPRSVIFGVKWQFFD